MTAVHDYQGYNHVKCARFVLLLVRDEPTSGSIHFAFGGGAGKINKIKYSATSI